MKRLLLPLLAALALPTAVNANWFGKYNSQVEAKEACDKWKANGIKFTYQADWGDEKFYKRNNRFCKHEDSTRQYLGYETKGVQEGQYYLKDVYKNMKKNKKIDYKIKKYFKY